MQATAYICIHAGADVAVEATESADLAEILQECGEVMPKALIKTSWLGEFKKTGPWWYRITNVDTHGPRIGLWLVRELCARGWEVFQVGHGTPTTYDLRRRG